MKKYGKRPPISVHILVILKVLVHLLLQTVFSYSIVSILVGNPRFQCGLQRKDCYSHTRYKLLNITLKVYSRVFVSNFRTKLLSLHFWIYFVPNVSGSCYFSKFYYGYLYKFWVKNVLAKKILGLPSRIELYQRYSFPYFRPGVSKGPDKNIISISKTNDNLKKNPVKIRWFVDPHCNEIINIRMKNILVLLIPNWKNL